MIDSETSLAAVDVQLIHVEAPREGECLTGAVGVEPEEVGLQVAYLEISLYGMQSTAREGSYPVESEGGRRLSSYLSASRRVQMYVPPISVRATRWVCKPPSPPFVCVVMSYVEQL